MKQGLTPEVLGSLSGNMWSGFTYICTEIALAGAVDWSVVLKENAEFKKKLKAEREAEQAEDSVAEEDTDSDDEVATRMPAEAMSDDE